MGGKGAGAPPNYQGAAQAQAASSGAAVGAQTRANRPDQTNAFGTTSSWTQGPDGQWVQQNRFGGDVGDLSHILGGAARTAAATPLGTGDSARQEATDASMAYARSQMDPQFARRQESLDAQLANQGLSPTDQAAQVEQDQLGRERESAYLGAQANAQQVGTQAQQVTFGENLAAHQLPLQQLESLGALGQQSGFVGAGQADPAQLLQAAQLLGNYQLGNSGQQMQAWGSGLQGILGAGGALGAAAILSDERAKADVRRSPDEEVLPGVPLATFRYKGSRRRLAGVIAQDVERAGHHHLVGEMAGVKVVHPSLRPFSF